MKYIILVTINQFQKALKIKIKIKYLGMQKGDIVKSKSDQSKLFNAIKFAPQTTIKMGIKKFIEWYTIYNNIK
jgi:UDP-glucuronate 4-epimerase